MHLFYFLFWLHENRSVRLLLQVALRLQSRLILGRLTNPTVSSPRPFSLRPALARLFEISLVSIGCNCSSVEASLQNPGAGSMGTGDDRRINTT